MPTFPHPPQLAGAPLLQHEPLARHTTARVGGAADYLLIAQTELQLQAAWHWAHQRGIPVTVLGAGSNVLVSDEGVEGLVILNRSQEMLFLQQGGYWQITASSGISLPRLARLCAEKGATGLEWAATVPGTVGGAVFGNAGAYGSAISDQLQTVTILTADSEEQQWPLAALACQYRSSRLKRAAPRANLIVSVQFLLPRGDSTRSHEAILAYQAKRRATQPPGASMGSMFQNPRGEVAGRLIERVGLKGHSIGDAQISPVHANFFINQEQATARDLLALARLAQQRVAEQTGFRLELEVELIGRWT